MTRFVDINCDMGESFGQYRIGNDDELIKYISSANVACGYHAGDPSIMNHTVKMAKKHGVGVGAHPGFPDLAGFGRRDMDIPREDFINLIIYQIGALDIFCKKHDIELKHIKSHGSLGNMADSDKEIATSIVDAIQSIKPQLPIYVKPNSELHKAAERKGLPYKLEIFADRAYQSEFSLVPRSEEGAVLTNPSYVADRVLQMVMDREITTITGEKIKVDVDTVCIHGDTPNALEMIKMIKRKLESSGFEIRSPI